MVTASGLRFAATLAVLGFLGFFEVGISRQSPHPGGGRINVRHGSGQRPQGQASVDDEHEKEKPPWDQADWSGAFPAAALFSSAQLFEQLTAVALLIGHGMALAKWG